jgi:hypothetical protein
VSCAGVRRLLVGVRVAAGFSADFAGAAGLTAALLVFAGLSVMLRVLVVRGASRPKW